MDDRLKQHPLGFWQVCNIPDAESLRSYYSEKYYQTSQSNYRPAYPDNEKAWFDIKTSRLAAAAQEVRASTKKGKLLDVGCGEGFAMAWFARNGWDVQGIDISSAGLDTMNPLLSDRLMVGDVDDLLGKLISTGCNYDLIWLQNVLEHVVDPVKLLSRLRELVAVGGACVVTVPNDGSEWQEFLFREKNIPRRFWIAIPDHPSYFNSESLRSAAEATGWICSRILADFPIDWFLGNPNSEYVSDSRKGKGAHQARIAVDTVLANQPVDRVNALYEAMAAVGMGRQLTAILMRNK